MMRSTPLLMLPLLAALLPACATLDQALPPGSTESAVRAQLGEPTGLQPRADGGRVLEYSGQPYGTRCVQVRLGGDGRVVSVEDVLEEAGRARVQPGMGRAEVERLLCPPRAEDHFVLSGETVLEWNIRNDGPGIATLFNVHFRDGVVLRTSITWVFPGGSADRD